MTAGRNMEDHNIQMIRQLIMGAFATVALKQLDQKAVKIGITSWLPLKVETMKLAADSLDWEQALEARKATKSVSSVDLVTPDPMTSLEQVLSMLCNFSSDIDALWISDQKKEKSLSSQEG